MGPRKAWVWRSFKSALGGGLPVASWRLARTRAARVRAALAAEEDDEPFPVLRGLPDALLAVLQQPAGPEVEPAARREVWITAPDTIIGRCPLVWQRVGGDAGAVYHRDRSLSEDLQGAVDVDHCGRVLVEADADEPGEGYRGQEPAHPTTLLEVLVHHHAVDQAQPGGDGSSDVGLAPERPNATMCVEAALAPAEVPATTAPRSWAPDQGVLELVPRPPRPAGPGSLR